MEFCYIVTLTSDENEAKNIAKYIVENKFASCVNIVPKVLSIYSWKDEICEEAEYMLLIKTRKDYFERVKKIILEKHHYELPAVFSIPFDQGCERFFEWIRTETQK